MTPILQKIFEIVPLDRPLVPALKSNWLLMHVSVMIVAYAALMIGSLGVVVSANNSRVYNSGYKAVGVGYIFLTLGIISGAVWANEAWGTYWSWDPKETWALVTWLVYATYLHSGSKWFAGLGLTSIFMCFYGFQFLATSLHNY